jgi:transcriptional regulator with GAF, ATPase, and Fis domain
METMRIESAEARLRRCEEQMELWRAEQDRRDERELGLNSTIEHLRSENRQLAERQAVAEQRVGQLAQFQAALQQLHEAEDRETVVTVIKEIVANLVGSECMALYATGADGSLELIDGIGIGDEHASDASSAVISVPLRMGDKVVGLLAIFKLLPQKPRIDATDHELFALLAIHAPLALHNAGLRAAYANFV